MNLRMILGVACVVVAIALAPTAYGDQPAAKEGVAAAAPAAVAPSATSTPSTATAPSPPTRPQPKPISENVAKGLEWLAKNQLDNGARAQGEESAAMGGMDRIKAMPNVADTCMAVMALFRSGSTPKAGPYKDNVLKAVQFLCAQVEESDANSLDITALHGTRTQMKLGAHIDTFMAGQVLAELKDHMPDAKMTQRVTDAMAKIAAKMERNQQKDGRWATDGWAPTLAQAQAAKAINAITSNGGTVSEAVRAKAEEYARKDFASGAGKGSEGSAGVALYSAGAQIAAMQSSDSVNTAKRERLAAVANSATSQPEDKEAAQATLARYDDNARDLDRAQKAFVARMEDKQFISGFGSNGGEEFLSYLNVGESLFIKGGDDWQKWDKSISDNVNRIQNQDGTWSGHHCITGRTFCTSAALMVLMIDRSPTSASAKIEQAKGR